MAKVKVEEQLKVRCKTNAAVMKTREPEIKSDKSLAEV